MGFVDPWPSAAELADLYSEEYAYFQRSGVSPAVEARSLKYRIAGLRYRRLVGGGHLSAPAALLAGLVEILSWKTISYSLGVPLSLARDSQMLDYGCGSGDWLLSMRERGYENLFGYDLDANARYSETLRQARIEAVDVRAFGSGLQGKLDLVRLEHVFENLADPKQVLADIHRVLRPGGWLVMTFPSMHPWLRVEDLASSPLRPYLQLPMHVVHHSRESCRRVLEEAGFHVVGLRLTKRENFLSVAARRR